VLVDHCLRSNGGLFYADRDEFVEGLKLLVADERLRAAMGGQGASTCAATTAGTWSSESSTGSLRGSDNKLRDLVIW
jgi:hypothetical protein